MAKRMYSMGYHAPNDKCVILIYADRQESIIMGYEPCAIVRLIGAKLLDGKFAVDIGCHIIAVGGLQTTVNHNEVAAEDAGIAHAVTVYTGVERCFRMVNNLARDINPVGIIGSRRRETRMNAFGKLQHQFVLLRFGQVFEFGLKCLSIMDG